MVRHVHVCELAWLLLHDAIKLIGCITAQALHDIGVSEAEAAELQSLRVVGGVGHDGTHRCAEPVSNIGVTRAIGQGEGLESGATCAH
jgi:hypothetical protein